MAGKLGSRLAQLANAKKQATDKTEISKEDLERIEAEQAASNLNTLQLILQPHIDEFNEMADTSLRITLETKPPDLAIKQSGVRLLTVEVKAQAAVFKRKGDDYTSDDYFTIDAAPSTPITFRRYAANVEKPLDGNQFAEFLLMEALGLNE